LVLAALPLLVGASPSAAAFGYLTHWDFGDGQVYGSSVYDQVDVDSGGNVHVADAARSRVQKYSSTGAFLSTFGTSSNSPVEGKFTLGPHGLTIDPSGNIYTVDGWTNNSNRVQKWSSAGIYSDTWWEVGDNFTSGLASAPDGNIFAATSNDGMVRKFSPTGTLLDSWGGYGTGNGEFRRITGIAVGPDGSVYVGDAGQNGVETNPSIKVFTNSGTFVTKWGTEGTGDGQFTRITGIAADATGNIWVGDDADAGPRIQKYSPTGTFLAKWEGDTSPPFQSFYCPGQLATDAQDDVYVVEWCGNTIWKFGEGGTAGPPPPPPGGGGGGQPPTIFTPTGDEDGNPSGAGTKKVKRCRKGFKRVKGKCKPKRRK
jgi:tripartite motif-containing protein 71